ncbi:unnamed protein product, partial [Brassica rapa subsp. trilocularis]
AAARTRFGHQKHRRCLADRTSNGLRRSSSSSHHYRRSSMPPSLFTLSILLCFQVRNTKKCLDAVPMGFPAGDMGRPAMNPAPRNPTPARPANLRVMIISAQARPRPSPYKPRPAVQYISCHP